MKHPEQDARFRRRETPAGPIGYLTTSEAAQRLGFAQGTISMFVRTGQLRGVKQGHNLYVSEEQVDAMVAEQQAGRAAGIGAMEELVADELEAILDRCAPEQWQAAGWVLARSEPTCRRRGHPLAEVYVGFEHGTMCAVCGRVYLSGRINQRLVQYASQRQSLQEAS